MAVNDTAQLAVKGTVLGQTHVHTLHFRNIDGLATEQAIIDAWQTNARTAYRNMFDNSDTPVDLITARQICGTVPLRAPVEEVEVAPNRVGGADFTTDPMAPWLAGIVSVRTSSAGRSRRGRFYIGGLYESEVNGAQLVANHIARLQAYVDALVTNFVTPATPASGWKLVVHSRKLAAVPGTQCQNSSTFVAGMIVRADMGSMRSRKAGSGT